MKPKYSITMLCIIAVVILELYALSQGINGQILRIVVAGLLGGGLWVMPQPKFMRK